MRVDSRVLALSWVPSHTVEGVGRLPFLIGLARPDDPPPDQLENAEALIAGDRVRQLNELRAWVEFDDGGRPVEWGCEPARAASEAGLPVLRPVPEVSDRSVRFVQTAGGPVGRSVPRRVLGKPFVRVDAPVSWTTVALTIAADGGQGALLGSSPYPRHWLYDDQGRLQAKSAEADYRRWLEGSHGDRTPWGEEDSAAFVAAAESALERQLERRIMSSRPHVARIDEGTMLTEQGDRDDTIYLVLDGVLDVDVGGQTVAEVGPGAIVGERASLDGRRRATLRARTACRVVPLRASSLTVEEREQLALGHRHEDD
jgi:hypothetical protein